MYPAQNKAVVDALAKKHATVFAMGKISKIYSNAKEHVKPI